MIKFEDVICRPIWTCGRYNEKGQVAIYYNLLEGMSYLFEGYSALVVSILLAEPRNVCFPISMVSERTGIAMESILPFFKKLMELGLIIDHCPDTCEISEYRHQQRKLNLIQGKRFERSTEIKLPMDVSTVEMDYANKAGGITSVMLELTYRCSEKCVHCYNIGATRNDEEISYRNAIEELSLEDYIRIIDELYEQGLIKVCLSGGDPFSNPYVWDIIDYLFNKEIAFDVYTNGLCLFNFVEKLADYYPRLVGISIYSGISSVHDSITRIKGSWEKSMSVVRKITEFGVPLVLKCCVMKPNISSYYMVAELAKEYGAFIQYELNVTDSIEGDKCVSNYLRLSSEAMEIVLRDPNTPMYVGEEAPNYGGQPKRMKENACGAGYNSFCITPDGSFVPCCSFHYRFGNLKKMSVKDLLFTSTKLKYWQSLSLQDYQDCGRHKYCDYCNLCPGCNYSEHGDVLQPGENNCFMAKCRFALANKLKEGKDPLEGKPIYDKLKELYPTQPAIGKIKRMFNT